VTVDQNPDASEVEVGAPPACEGPTSGAVDVVTGTDEAATDAESKPPKTKRRLRVKLVPVLLTVVLVAAAGLAAWLYLFQFRDDQQTNDAAAKVVVKAASDGTVALLSYSPESLDRDFAAAKTHLTGDFLSYYNQFTTQIVTPAAKQKSVKTTAAVNRAAVSEVHPESAVVLLFVNQTTTSADRTEPSLTASSVRVSLQKIDGAWLISSFDPV
jgi:Mce-associated membrane protein